MDSRISTRNIPEHNEIAQRPAVLRKRFALVSLSAAIMTACAPVLEGPDQCKDTNVDLLEITDAKYTNLPEVEGGLSAAKRAEIDAIVATYRNVLYTANGQPKLVNGAPMVRDNPIAGCAIAVTRDTQVSYLQGYGFADINSLRSFTVATPSAIGSISKTLTALGTLALSKRAVDPLSLDAGVLAQMQLTPLVDVAWSEFTVRQMLGHRAGFVGGGNMVWDPLAFDDGPSIAAAFPNIERPSLRPLFVFQGYKMHAGNQPHGIGGTVTYSNAGYSMAGTLIDYRSRQPDIPTYQQGYESYLWHTVGRGTKADAPNMTSMCLATDFRTNDIKNLATGYDQDGSQLSYGDSSKVGWGWEGPSGGWTMTIGDLARLMVILQSDAVLPKAFIDSDMRASQGLFGANRMGLGLELAASGSDGWFGKGGNILGYTADFKIWPSAQGPDWGVAFMCNQSFAGPGLTRAIQSTLQGSVPGGVQSGDPGVAPPTASPATISLVKRYESQVRGVAARYLTDAISGERAWTLAKADLTRSSAGRTLVGAIERGDYVGAARAVPAALQTLPPR
ncbi:MAG: serine hydrolase domain-containing protein [Pseudomonadota bacterium]|nr:serine hydrolase domain-containing protein [Pseudomonadota bacterium]